jgi:hypothetical protein
MGGEPSFQITTSWACAQGSAKRACFLRSSVTVTSAAMTSPSPLSRAGSMSFQPLVMIMSTRMPSFCASFFPIS